MDDLLESGAVVNESIPVLHRACSESKPCLVETACSEGQMDVIDTLLESGFDVNSRVRGTYPLHLACSGSSSWSIDLVTKLITHGADVDLEDSYEWNALDCALDAVTFQPHIAQLLLDCSKKEINRLDSHGFGYFWTARSNEAIEFLVKNGIDVGQIVNEQTDLGSTRPDQIAYLQSIKSKLYSKL